ncbi:MAG: FAD-binding protein [Candidatus Howiella sp.]|jgi:succinate dehydrogenase/fumarate reductase flavoprotein subunit
MQTSFDTIIVGSGAAGYGAADWLYSLGRNNIALLTEGRLWGASRNAGSDKQTYYKLSLAGEEGDSVRQMAADLFAGGADGDTALCEAAGSVRCFMKLATLGVPFPTNTYGEFVGYKTDHDPRRRATSAGPLTSRYMTEALERAVRAKGIPILDGFAAVNILTRSGEVAGLLAMEGASNRPVVFSCANLILATGGTAGVYADSVFPESQTGGLALAAEAGAALCNLHIWQYGLASVRPRWNLSGSYQQCLPRYLSLDKTGRWREFLPGYFDRPEEALNRIFLKGYEWPFDPEKATGSSLIDLIVLHETKTLGRRVFLDFRENPAGLETGVDRLSPVCRSYLENCGAVSGRPIDRLRAINPAAIELYRSKGADLAAEPLEIAVCAQHQNGGAAVDENWQTTVRGLYAVGECAGTFGNRRPGGSALNAGQVGGLRAAEHIARTRPAKAAVPPPATPIFTPTPENHLALRKTFARRMSRSAAVLRSPGEMAALEADLADALGRLGFPDTAAGQKTRDLLYSARLIVQAMRYAAAREGSTGGGMILCDDGIPLLDFRYRPGNAGKDILMTEGERLFYRPRRPIPAADDWFERVWADFRRRSGSA